MSKGSSSKTRPESYSDSPVTEKSLLSILNNFKCDISKIIEQTVTKVVTEKLNEMCQRISDFHEALSFLSIQYDELKGRQCENTSIIQRLQSENSLLTTTVKDLSLRLTLSEQHQRENNVEINGIPEHRSEILPNCIMQLAKVVKSPLVDEDIVQVTRVAKMNKDDKRPRAIVAKLRSPRQRDVLLAAIQNFNKTNPEDKLSSYHLGLAGAKSPVFVSEHLTPSNKSLHAATRKQAKDMSFKFVWVRNGRIYVRKNETAQAIYIRGPDSLKLIQ